MVFEKEQPPAKEDVISLERGNFFWNSVQVKDNFLGKIHKPTRGIGSIIGVFDSKKI